MHLIRHQVEYLLDKQVPSILKDIDQDSGQAKEYIHMMGEAGKVKMTWWQAQIDAYQQQESWVWRPVYNVHTMWWPFLGMGCVMFVLGLGMMSVQGNYNEIEWDYTDCNCTDTGIKAMDHLETHGQLIASVPS